MTTPLTAEKLAEIERYWDEWLDDNAGGANTIPMHVVDWRALISTARAGIAARGLAEAAQVVDALNKSGGDWHFRATEFHELRCALSAYRAATSAPSEAEATDGWLCPKCGEHMDRPVSDDDCGHLLCPGKQAEASVRDVDAKCPRCGSPDPKKHPAVQFEGEVQLCPHEFHNPVPSDSAYLAAQFPATPAMQEMRDRAEKIGGKSV